MISVVLYVRHPEPWMTNITVMAAKTLLENAVEEIQLIIVECLANNYERLQSIGHDFEYIHFDKPEGLAIEMNAGLNYVNNEYVIVVGNDVILPLEWDEYILEPHDRFDDCGVSTLACSDIHATTQDLITESFWGPLMCFKKGFTFDPDFTRMFADTDLCMRLYEQGKRSYRNLRCRAVHINKFTQTAMFSPEVTEQQINEGKALFIEKHKDKGNHLWQFHAFINGWVW